MRLSDEIAGLIMNMLENSDGTAEIRRNDLAERIGCVPSQINYVLTSRFTPEQGYIVESRRGGGGYIRIRRISSSPAMTIMHIVNSIGKKIDQSSSYAIIDSLYQRSIISREAAVLMKTALSDKCYASVPTQSRDAVRAQIFKHMLLTQV